MVEKKRREEGRAGGVKWGVDRGIKEEGEKSAIEAGWGRVVDKKETCKIGGRK